MDGISLVCMKFNGISDELWEFIELLLPPHAKEGKPRADDRQTINAILYVLKTGMPWNDLPEEYGDDVTAWRRLRDWEELGVWKKIMDALIARGGTRWAPSIWTRSRSTAILSLRKRGSSCWL